MPSAAWFFSTLAQSTAASIGFIIALATVLVERANDHQGEKLIGIFDQILKQCKVLFVLGVIIPMFFLTTEPTSIEVSSKIPYYEQSLLFVQTTLTLTVGIYGYLLLTKFQLMIQTIEENKQNIINQR